MAKLRKLFFRGMYEIFYKHLPASFSVGGKIAKKLRGHAVKGFIVSCGKNVNIERGANISSKLSIGDNSGIGINCEVIGSTVIGNDVMMGPECVIFTRNHQIERTDVSMRLQGFTEEKPVIIEDDVWIGQRVMIMPGIRVGKGSVIGAGAVVTKDVPRYAVVGGVPAKVIRYRKKDTLYVQNND